MMLLRLCHSMVIPFSSTHPRRSLRRCPILLSPSHRFLLSVSLLGQSQTTTISALPSQPLIINSLLIPIPIPILTSLMISPLSNSGEAKVADYGLARLLPMLDRYVLSSKIQSALGYMAPEFACKTVKITEKCDIYGFGILVREIVTGKRPVEYMEDDVVVPSDMVRGALEEGKVVECVDGKLQGKFPAEEAIPVMKLGLICTSQVPSNRPDMAEVVIILELIRCPSESQDEVGDFS